MLEGIADLLKIDKIIEDWAKKLGLHIQTNYKEFERVLYLEFRCSTK